MTKKYLLKTNYRIILPIVLLIILLSNYLSNAQEKTDIKWTEIFTIHQAILYDFQKDFSKQEQAWEKQDRRAKRRGEEIKEHSGEEVFKRWEAYMKPRVYPSGNINLPSSNYQNYTTWQEEHVQETKKNRSGNWTALGPIGKPNTPLGQAYRTGTGRLNFIAIDPTNVQKIYVGTPDGGMWFTTNGGTSWSNNNDFLGVIGCCDLVIDPTNTQVMYLATGDREGDRRSIGVLKTINGGATWTPTSISWTLQNNYKTARLLMDPTNSLKMILATDDGTFSTTDGWVTNSQGTFPSGNPILKDMELKPGDANTVYCSGTKLYKSTNFGANWVEITTGLPSTNISRIALAVSPANANYVYALYGKASDQSFMGLYRSTNSGTSFTTQYTGPLNLLGYELNGLDLGSGQAFYDLELEVNPSDINIVTLATINQWQTTDGGATWTIKSHWTGAGGKPTVHSDFHCMHYQPGSSSILYSGSDGGLWKSTDDGSTWADISNNLNISQINKLGISQSNANLIIAGMQDNGTNIKNGASWGNIFGGDGGESFVDWNDNNTIYYCYVESEIHRSDDGGVNDIQITTGLPNGGGVADFYSSFHQDPTVASRLYAGGHVEFYRSNNKGDNWTMLGTPSGTGNITEFAIATTNNQIIYAVKSDAVSKSVNGGTSWTNISGTLPVGSASPVMIAVSNTDAQKVWVVFSGYSAGNKVFKSIDGGTTWTNISTGLPNLPMTTVLSVKNSPSDAIYIGADIGVYYSSTSYPSAVSYFTALPNVSVRDLEIQYATGKIRAATYGRGVWESDTFSSAPLPVVINEFSGKDRNYYNEINWSTSQETNLDRFEIEKSDDGKYFTSIGEVKSVNNNSSTLTAYHFNDYEKRQSINYYRLKSIDIDGNSRLSQVVKIISNELVDYQIFPNPAHANLSINIHNENYHIKLKDVNGRIIFSQNNNSFNTQIDTRSIANGVYFLQVKTDDKSIEFIQSIEIKH